MIRTLWIARTGINAQQVSLEVIANNLANLSTPGFKRQRPVFEDLLYQTLRQPGAQSSQSTQIPSGLQIGTGVSPVATATIFTQGALQQTGNALDVAIDGQGFLQILLPDGTTAYTRDGSFQKDNQGQLVTSSGYPVQPSITIPSDALTVTIANDGVVSVTQPGNSSATQVGSRPCATPAPTRPSPTPNTPGTNGSGVLLQTYVETANVNVAEELVSMIQTQRAYEMNTKAVRTADEMLARLGQL